ncbi:hypothetical protein ABZ621_31490 [Streptomyces sp. NPDC007863]|uniref:hypothetical protein n=1 Tax=Streptomyces sp. NPDC007863 TaxID=3154894 RepID=UPI003406766A
MSALVVGLWAYARRQVPRRDRLYVFEGGVLCGPPAGAQSAYPWSGIRAVRRSKGLVTTGLESGTVTTLRLQVPDGRLLARIHLPQGSPAPGSAADVVAGLVGGEKP